MEVSSWGARIGSYVIDVICACILGVGACLLVGGLAGAVDFGNAAGEEASLATLAFFTAIVNYSPLLRARSGRRSGQTLGRQLIGTRVVLADGQRLR